MDDNSARKRRPPIVAGGAAGPSPSSREEVDCESVSRIPLTRIACGSLAAVIILLIVFQFVIGPPPSISGVINGAPSIADARPSWYMPPAAIGRIYVHDARFSDVIDVAAASESFEVLADGFKWPEGLQWVTSSRTKASRTSTSGNVIMSTYLFFQHSYFSASVV